MYSAILSQPTSRIKDPMVEAFRDPNFLPVETYGVSGVQVYGGFLQSHERDSRLVGTNKYLTFSDMLANRTIIATGVRSALGLITKPAWKWEPADDSPQAEEYAQFVEKCLTTMVTPWNRVVQGAAMHRFYGFSAAEWTARRNDDGSIGLLDVQRRPQSTIYRWHVAPDGELLGLVQLDPQTGKELLIPRGKLFYCVDDALDNTPEGMGLFRHLVNAATALERYEQLEGWGFETDLRGVPVGRAPLAAMKAAVASGQMTEAQFTESKAVVADFVKKRIRTPQQSITLDSAVYTTQDATQSPSNVKQWDVEILKAESSSQAEVSAAITRINLEIARLLGCEHLLLGGDSAGSLALSRDKSKNVALLIDGILLQIREAVDKDLIRVIGDLNGWDPALLPKSKTETVQWRDVEQVTQGLRDMATAGAILAPTDPAIDAVRDLLGLPDQVEVSDALAVDAAIGGQRASAVPAPSMDEAPMSDREKSDANEEDA